MKKQNLNLKLLIPFFGLFAAVFFFSSCEDDAIVGCTDSSALNYNAEATEDGGDCMYNQDRFSGSYLGSLVCDGLLDILSTDTVTFEISTNPNSLDSVYIAFTSGTIALLGVQSGYVSNDVITVLQTGENQPIDFMGIMVNGDITISGMLNLINDDSTIEGPLTVSIKSSETGATLIDSETCIFSGNKI